MTYQMPSPFDAVLKLISSLAWIVVADTFQTTCNAQSDVSSRGLLCLEGYWPGLPEVSSSTTRSCDTGQQALQTVIVRLQPPTPLQPHTTLGDPSMCLSAQVA